MTHASRPHARPRRRSPRTIASLLGLALTLAVIAFLPSGFATSASAASGGPIVLDGMDPVCHDEAGEATGGYIRAVVSSLHAEASNTNDGSIAVIDPSDANSCGDSLSDRMSGYLQRHPHDAGRGVRGHGDRDRHPVRGPGLRRRKARRALDPGRLEPRPRPWTTHSPPTRRVSRTSSIPVAPCSPASTPMAG